MSFVTFSHTSNIKEGAGIPQEPANEEEAVGAGGDEQDGGNSPSGEIEESETQGIYDFSPESSIISFWKDSIHLTRSGL